MAKSFEQNLYYAAPYQKVYIAFYQALKVLDMENIFDDQASGQLAAHNSHSYTTFGEDIQIRIMAQPNGCNVYICSRCTYSTQKFDFGKNKKNVNKIIKVAANYL